MRWIVALLLLGPVFSQELPFDSPSTAPVPDRIAALRKESIRLEKLIESLHERLGLESTERARDVKILHAVIEKQGEIIADAGDEQSKKVAAQIKGLLDLQTLQMENNKKEMDAFETLIFKEVNSLERQVAELAKAINRASEKKP